MDRALRHYFDKQLDAVLPKLPQMVHDALDEIQMIVEDYPPKRLIEEFQLEHRDELQGLYTGSLRTDNESSGTSDLPEAIYLFREGILAMATDEHGNVDEPELREQIRITVMHEVGHYYGLDEDDLSEKGYG
jgi:predicted Zn-dependent protease with MMP-like domain